MKTVPAKAAKVVAPVARASGGKAQVVSGNKNVLKEAGESKDGDNDHKKGGAVKKRKKGGGVARLVSFMTGGTVRPRLDRPGRKAGGGVGANSSPLSTAHNTTGTAGVSSPTDSYGGTPK